MQAVEAIAELKATGRWMRRFDQYHLPALFSELEGTPALAHLVQVIKTLEDECDPFSQLLHERAKYLVQSRGFTFDEALTFASAMPPSVISVGVPNSHGGAWGSPISPKVREQEREEGLEIIARNLLPEQIVMKSG